MKRIICLLIAILALLAVPASASEIDTASMTWDELSAIRQQILQEQMTRPEWESEDHIYAGAKIVKGNGGSYSILEIPSFACSQEDILDWYFCHIKAGGLNYGLIIYTDKPSRGVYGAHGMIQTGVSISKDSTGDYTFKSISSTRFFYARSEPYRLVEF